MTVIGRPLPERRPLPQPRGLEGLPVRGKRPLPAPNATLVSREDVTGTLGVFVVTLDEPLRAFKPGQYVSVGMASNGELVQRPYSVVSLRQGGTRVELFVRRLPDGRFSNMLWQQSVGARLVIGPAKGLFVVDEEDRRPRLMVGTGTGVAPLLAMLEQAAERRDHTPNVLVHGASYHVELAYRSRVESWIERGLVLDYRPTVSRPHDERNGGWSGHVGRAEAQLAAILEEWRWLRAGGSVAYLCGNPDMIEACSAVLHAAEFAPADVRTELFHPPVGAPRPV